MSYNEADTRAKLIDPALYARQCIELVSDTQYAFDAVRLKVAESKAKCAAIRDASQALIPATLERIFAPAA